LHQSGTAEPARIDTSNMPKQSSKKTVETSTGPRRKPVKEVAHDEPKPLQEKSSVKDAGEKMRSLKSDKFPVASGDRLVGTVVGKYSDRKAAGFGHDPAKTSVRGIMAKPFYCFEQQSIDEAREMMRKYQLKHLPVVDSKLRIVGIVALTDLAQSNRPQTGK
jgi:CBS domain-containing protein